MNTATIPQVSSVNKEDEYEQQAKEVYENLLREKKALKKTTKFIDKTHRTVLCCRDLCLMIFVSCMILFVVACLLLVNKIQSLIPGAHAISTNINYNKARQHLRPRRFVYEQVGKRLHVFASMETTNSVTVEDTEYEDNTVTITDNTNEKTISSIPHGDNDSWIYSSPPLDPSCFALFNMHYWDLRSAGIKIPVAVVYLYIQEMSGAQDSACLTTRNNTDSMLQLNFKKKRTLAIQLLHTWSTMSGIQTEDNELFSHESNNAEVRETEFLLDELLTLYYHKPNSSSPVDEANPCWLYIYRKAKEPGAFGSSKYNDVLIQATRRVNITDCDKLHKSYLSAWNFFVLELYKKIK